MGESIITFLTDLTSFNDWFGLIFFWSPMFLNALGYTLHCWDRVQKDKLAVRDNEKYHYEFLTIGDLFWYLFLTVAPIVNCIAFIFDCLPDLFKFLTKRLGWLFYIKLVKDTRKK